jgi:hypothetical protein
MGSELRRRKRFERDVQPPSFPKGQAVCDLFSVKNVSVRMIEQAPLPSGKPVATIRNLIAAAIAALSLSACADTQEYPIAPNMVRLDVSPPTAPFIGETTLRRAAEITLRNGYSAFRLEPIYVESFDNFGVIVVMFHANDPRAAGAYDAAAVLGKYS